MVFPLPHLLYAHLMFPHQSQPDLVVGEILHHLLLCVLLTFLRLIELVQVVGEILHHNLLYARPTFHHNHHH